MDASVARASSFGLFVDRAWRGEYVFIGLQYRNKCQSQPPCYPTAANLGLDM